VARNQNRPGILGALEFARIQELAKGPKVSDDIQLTYSLGDLSALIPALAAPRYAMTEVGPVQVATRSFITIKPPPDSAIIVPWFRNDKIAPTLLWGVTSTDPITLGRATVSADVQIGGAPRAITEDGNGADPGGNILLAAGEDLPSNFPPLVIPPGSLMYWMSDANNDSVNLTMTWIEVPLVATTTP